MYVILNDVGDKKNSVGEVNKQQGVLVELSLVGLACDIGLSGARGCRFAASLAGGAIIACKTGRREESLQQLVVNHGYYLHAPSTVGTTMR